MKRNFTNSASRDLLHDVALETGHLRLWVLAAVATMMLHVGCFAFLANYLKPEEADDAMGTPAVEVGIELLAPRQPETDLPVGEAADDSMASPAVMAQRANLKEKQLPKDQPVESDDPDRVVAPHESTHPKEDEPTIKATETMPSPESAPSRAAAPPVSDIAKPSERSTAPVLGIGKSDVLARVTWEKKLVVHLSRHKRYPSNERRRNIKVIVRFTIDRMGHLLSAEVIGGDGDAAFNTAALGMLKRSDPVPPPPSSIADDGLTFALPVIFRARGE
ncbi:MAG: energy transducer TonB [Beijerinckiaceae bacterium]|nr:MAG: energy transducer TonB [Beijerinckiaceae bacterium]